MDLVNVAKTYAIVPVSKFLVGVVVRCSLTQCRLLKICSSKGVTASGNVYMGCNMEFSNVPLNFSVHAEQCLIASAQLHIILHLLPTMLVGWICTVLCNKVPPL